MQAQKKAFLEACFFTMFFDFDLKNNQFFNGFLLRSSIQIALIFGAISPSQSIVFKLVFDTFEHRMQKMISYKNMYSLGEITIFKVSSITESSKFSKQMMQQHIQKQ